MRHRNDWLLSSRFNPQEDSLCDGGRFRKEDEDSFSIWLNEQLEQMEERHRDFRPRSFRIVVVIAYC